MQFDKKYLALVIANIVIGSSLTYGFIQLNTKANSNEISIAKLKDEIIESTKQVPAQTLSAKELEAMLIDNPEAIIKSLAKYRFEQEQRAEVDMKNVIDKQLNALYADANDPFIGNPNGKHVVVEFIDYNCGFCKRLTPILKEFVSIDPEAKVIVKEFPIFQNNPTSAYSALIATAVFYYRPEIYNDIHTAFMSNSLTREFIDKTLEKLGISHKDLEPYLDKAKQQIEIVRQLGIELQVTGTPTVFIGNEKLKGGISSAVELKTRFSENQ